MSEITRETIIHELEQIREHTLQQFDDIRRFFRLMRIAETIVWRHLPLVLEKVMLHIASTSSNDERSEIEEWVSANNQNQVKRPLEKNTAAFYADFMLRVSDMLEHLSPDLFGDWRLALEIDRKQLKDKPHMLYELLLRQSLILGVSAMEDSFTRTIDMVAPVLGWDEPKGCLFGGILNDYTPKFLDIHNPIYKELFDSIKEIRETRNLFVHRDGKITERYATNFPFSGLQPGDIRIIDDAYLHTALLHLEGFSITIIDVALGDMRKAIKGNKSKG